LILYLCLFLVLSFIPCKLLAVKGENGPDFLSIKKGIIISRVYINNDSHSMAVDNGFSSANWSSDSKKIAFFEVENWDDSKTETPQEVSIVIYDIETGQKTTLCKTYQSQYPKDVYFSPDDAKILFSAYENSETYALQEDGNFLNHIGVYWIYADGSNNPQRVISYNPVGEPLPVWIDNNNIAIILEDDSGLTKLISANLTDGTTQVIYTPSGNLYEVKIGHPVVKEGKIFFSITSGYNEGAEDITPLYSKLGVIDANGADNGNPTWITPDGDCVDDFNIYRKKVNGKYRIVYTIGDDVTDISPSLYYVDVDISTSPYVIETPFKIYDGPSQNPFWSYDGEKIFFASPYVSGMFSTPEGLSSDFHLYYIGIDGTGFKDLYPMAGMPVAMPKWSPDGEKAFIHHNMDIVLPLPSDASEEDYENPMYSDDIDAGRSDVIVARLVSFSYETELDSGGGIAKDFNYNKVEVSEGALDENTVVGVTTSNPEEFPEMKDKASSGAVFIKNVTARGIEYTPAPLGSIFSGIVRYFEVKGTLKKPIKYNIYYSTTELSAAGINPSNESDLRAYFWTGSIWERIGGGVDTVNNIVYFYSNHSGSYGIFYESPHPAIDENFIDVKIQPNPFSPNGDGNDDTTRIKFATTISQEVTVEIYNIAGEKVVTLLEKEKRPSNQEWDLGWDGRNDYGEYVGSGIYLCVIEVDGKREIEKIAVVK